MTVRVLGPTGSRRRRRISLFVPLIIVLALLLPGLTLGIALPPGGAAVNNPTFEFDPNTVGVNGILTDDADADGVLDWDDTNQNGTDRAGEPVIEATRNPDGTCTQTNGPARAGGPGVIGAGLLVCDGSEGNFADQDAFTQGSKNEGTTWTIDNISNPRKADLAELMLYAKFGDSSADADMLADDLFVFTGATRLDKNGDTHMDVELNQQDVKRNCPDSEPATPGFQTVNCVVQRTNGDILIAIDLSQGGVVATLRVFEFKTTLESGESCENAPQVSPPCLVQLSGSVGSALGAVNDLQGQIQGPNWNSVGCDPTPPDDPAPGCRIRDDIMPRGFMETFTDLSAFGVEVTCPGFSNVIFKTRSSDSINSSLQDDAEAQINIAECSLAWEKRDDLNALQGGATFTVGTAGGSNGDGNGPFACIDANNVGDDDANPATVADNGPSDLDPDGGQIVLGNVCVGNYIVTETISPSGFALDDDVDRLVTVSAADPNAVIGTQGQDDPGNTDESDFHNRLGSIEWEKRDDQGVLQGGATFEVSGTPGPLACRGVSGTITVVDNGTNDANPVAGQYKLDRVCLGTYTVTETVAPPGFALPADPDREVTVSAANLNAVIGTIGQTDEFDFQNRLGTIEWEKRDDQGNLQGGATFTVGGASGPFACHDANTDGDDDANPVTVVDNGPNDADTDSGQYRLVRVCLGTYTVTETVAPPGFALPADPDREVTVSGADLNPSIGTIGETDEFDFRNRLGTIEWEKRDGSVSAPHPLQGGATFEVSGNGGPFDCHGTAGTITVIDNGTNDADPDAGQLRVDRVCLGSYTITETVPPPDFILDTDTTRNVTVSAADLSATVGTEPLGAPPGVDDEGTRVDGVCTDDACDFHNRRGSLLIRKEGKDASTLDPTDLLGGATFLITPNPFTGLGSLFVTDDGLDVNDSYPADAGLICLNNVVPGTYTPFRSSRLPPVTGAKRAARRWPRRRSRAPGARTPSRTRRWRTSCSTTSRCRRSR
jgi:Prealbumin-like fold domain